jgi:hypothetical protein
LGWSGKSFQPSYLCFTSSHIILLHSYIRLTSRFIPCHQLASITES